MQLPPWLPGRKPANLWKQNKLGGNSARMKKTYVQVWISKAPCSWMVFGKGRITWKSLQCLINVPMRSMSGTGRYKNLVMWHTPCSSSYPINSINSMVTNNTTRTSTAIANSGYTRHFLQVNSPCLNKTPTSNGLGVLLPDGSTIQATHMALLDRPNLPIPVHQAHIVTIFGYLSPAMSQCWEHCRTVRCVWAW
jgi:hypothetical protein